MCTHVARKPPPPRFGSRSSPRSLFATCARTRIGPSLFIQLQLRQLAFARHLTRSCIALLHRIAPGRFYQRRKHRFDLCVRKERRNTVPVSQTFGIFGTTRHPRDVVCAHTKETHPRDPRPCFRRRQTDKVTVVQLEEKEERGWRFISDACLLFPLVEPRAVPLAGLIRGCRLRHPIFGPYRPSEDLLPYLRFARPLSPGNKVNQPVFRYYPRVHSPLRKKERRHERKGREQEGAAGRWRGDRSDDETSTKDTRTTRTRAACAQFCGRMAERLLSSLVNNRRVVTWERERETREHLRRGWRRSPRNTSILSGCRVGISIR